MHFNITPISYALFFFAMESSIQSSNDGRNKNLIRIKFYSFFFIFTVLRFKFWNFKGANLYIFS